jgi:hypothetical protein
VIVVDDQLLLRILIGQEPEQLRSARASGVATTMCWFYRLSRAIAAGSTTGKLSGRFAALNAPRQGEVTRLVNELPGGIVTLDPRVVVPVMSALSSVASANLLTTEAVATALVLDADIAVSVRSALLERTSEAADVRVVLFD